MKFCKLGKSATKTNEMVKNMYSEEAVSRKTVFQWFKHFCEDCKSMEDDHHCGRPGLQKMLTKFSNYCYEIADCPSE